jgi:NADH dehydrogenase FAD-containing subunit
VEFSGESNSFFDDSFCFDSVFCFLFCFLNNRSFFLFSFSSFVVYDFVTSDVARLYPDLKSYVRITLVEASNRILTSFDASLGEFAAKIFARQGIKIEKGVAVKEVQPGKVVLQDGRTIEFGLLVWSTGFGATDLTQKLSLKKDRGRILTNSHLNVILDDKPLPDVYALGDCATVEKTNHAATAQMAKQKAHYLAKSKVAFFPFGFK